VAKVFTIDFQNMFVVTEQVAYFAYPLAVGRGYLPDPRRSITTLDIWELHSLSAIGYHKCFFPINRVTIYFGRNPLTSFGQELAYVHTEMLQFAYHRRRDAAQVGFGE